MLANGIALRFVSIDQIIGRGVEGLKIFCIKDDVAPVVIGTRVSVHFKNGFGRIVMLLIPKVIKVGQKCYRR